MSGKKKKDFKDVLESGAKVDEIFKDSPTPQGSDPYSMINIEPLAVEEAPPVTEVNISEDLKIPEIKFEENEGSVTINRKFAAVTSLFQLINKDCGFAELISDILHIALENIKSEAGSFFEVDYARDHMFFRAVAGRSEESQNLLHVTVPRGQGVVGYVCENQQTMALSRVDETSIFLKAISASVGFETKNLIAVPIIIRGVTFGCVELLNRLGEEKYTDTDKEVLNCICEYAAKVIENRLILASLGKEKENGEKEAA